MTVDELIEVLTSLPKSYEFLFCGEISACGPCCTSEVEIEVDHENKIVSLTVEVV